MGRSSSTSKKGDVIAQARSRGSRSFGLEKSSERSATQKPNTIDESSAMMPFFFQRIRSGSALMMISLKQNLEYFCEVETQGSADELRALPGQGAISGQIADLKFQILDSLGQ